MSIFDEMKSSKDRIEYLLNKTPHLRDDDYKLIATYFYYEIGKERLMHLSGLEVLKLFSEGTLTNPETIRRVRQKLQEEKPELRGDKYIHRKRGGDDIRGRINDEL